MPIMWCLAHPKIGEREVVAALLEHNHHLIRAGQILLADKGFAGREFHQFTQQLGLRLLRPDRKDETYRNGNLGGVRQLIESVNQTLKADSASKPTTAEHPPGSSPASPASARPGRRDLAQLEHRRQQQTITDRLRPLTQFKELALTVKSDVVCL
jgi:hypothetical protein